MPQVQPIHQRQSTHIAVAVMTLSALFTTVQIQAADDDAARKPDRVSAETANAASKTIADKGTQAALDAQANVKTKTIARGRSST